MKLLIKIFKIRWAAASRQAECQMDQKENNT